MNPTLKTYIDAQRANGVSDEITYSNLISSGWEHDLVAQALMPQADVVQAPSVYEQPVVQPVGPSAKSLKTVKVIGIITIVLGAIAVLASFLSGIDGLQLFFGVVEILIGVGLLVHHRAAYMAFNVVAILAILSSILMLPGLAFVGLLVTVSFSIEVLLGVFIALVLSVGQLGFYIYGGIALHNKNVHQLFRRN